MDPVESTTLSSVIGTGDREAAPSPQGEVYLSRNPSRLDDVVAE